jgi:hypothetical protein
VKKWSSLQRVLTGALALAVAGWAVDSLVRRGAPQAARAASATPGAQPASPADGEDSTELVERLLCNKYVPIAADLEQLERDLFVPTPLMQAATLSEPEAEGKSDPIAEPSATPDFASKHVLTGVIIGRAPLAQVDQRLLPLGAVLDGYTLVEIQRDIVIFQCPDSLERVPLELKKPAGRPSHNQ